jgi:hypothetical protein
VIAMVWLSKVGLAVAVGILTLAAPAATAKGPSTPPNTLVSSPRPIYAFAQDGNTMGWIASDARVRVRSLTTGKTWVVGRVDPSERAYGASLALAGTRALWAWDSGGNSYETAFASAAPGRAQSGFPGLAGGARNFGDGERFAGIAGDGVSLVFGWADETCAGAPFGVCDFCNPLGTCPLVVNGGGVAAVPPQAMSQRPPTIPNVPPPALLTVGSGRVAVVAARSPTPQGDWVPRVGEDTPVDVFDLGGRPVTHIPLIGTVRGVALSPNALAVLLERPDGSKVIVRYGLGTGIFLGGSDLLPLGATSLSVSTGGIVFRDGPRIYRLHGRKPRLVAVAGAAPIGLSIEGKRIAWAENMHGQGRIRTVSLR